MFSLGPSTLSANPFLAEAYKKGALNLSSASKSKKFENFIVDPFSAAVSRSILLMTQIVLSLAQAFLRTQRV